VTSLAVRLVLSVLGNVDSLAIYRRQCATIRVIYGVFTV
jgi:hypothetical protein